MKVPRSRFAVVAAVLGMVVVAGCGGNTAKKPSNPTRPSELTSQQVFALAAPGTVQLYGRKGTATYGGTGFIYDKAKGLVVTNAHVVDGLGTLRARYNDGSETPARIKASASCSDVAVVELLEPNASATALRLGDSGSVTPAQHVSALGYPSSFQQFDKSKVAFTEGSVQSTGVKAVIGDDLPTYPDTIQHSATINHGNSGGPLLDNKGNVVGVNTLTNFGAGAQGQFYSISINRIKALLPQLEGGKGIANPGWSVQPLSVASMEKMFPIFGWGDAALGKGGDLVLADLKVDGLVVTGLDSGRPAEKANLEVGDIVREMNGVPITTVSEMCDVLQSAKPGSTIGLNGTYTFTGTAKNEFGDVWTANMKAE